MSKLINYKNFAPMTVIEDDERDPYVSWQHHLDRTEGERGGVDLVAAVGTPIYAPTGGWVEQIPNNGDAGNSLRFHHHENEGWSDVFSHLSGYVGRDGADFSQGVVIGYTGDTGGVAPHLHRHLLDPNGVRQNPWDYFTNNTEMEIPMFVKIIGEGGVIRGGIYYIENGVATFLGSGGTADTVLTADQGVALRSRVSGI